MDDEELEKIFSHPLTVSVFAYLRKMNKPVGVREVQKALDIASPSTAYWHLNKLRNNFVIDQEPDNSYIIREEYNKLQKLPITMIVNHYIIAGRIIPSNFIIFTISLLFMFVTLVFILFRLWVGSSIFGLTSLIIITILLWITSKNQTNQNLN